MTSSSNASKNDNNDDDDDAARKRRRVEQGNVNPTTNHTPPSNQSSQQTQIITLQVRDQSGEETFFQIRKSTTMSKIFHAYARRMGVQLVSLRFLFKGNRIQDYETPEHWQMENNDQIDCTLKQTGC